MGVCHANENHSLKKQKRLSFIPRSFYQKIVSRKISTKCSTLFSQQSVDKCSKAASCPLVDVVLKRRYSEYDHSIVGFRFICHPHIICSDVCGTSILGDRRWLTYLLCLVFLLSLSALNSMPSNVNSLSCRSGVCERFASCCWYKAKKQHRITGPNFL